MAFSDFKYPKVMTQHGLTHGAGLFFDGGPPPFEVRSEVAAWIQHGVDIAEAVNTEKARSEFIVAQMLLELRRSLRGKFSVFSDEELTGGGRGLNGKCDFMLRKHENETVRPVPILAILEAKNDWAPYENGPCYPNGLGQCIATMVSARKFNRDLNWPVTRVFGAVTTGTLWKFLSLAGDALSISQDYKLEIPDPKRRGNIDNLPTIMGILQQIVQ